MTIRAPVRLAAVAPAQVADGRGMGIGAAVVFGIIVIVLFLGGFGVWSILASLETAAISQGRVTVDSKRKTVEHLEGGIVADILVEEGEDVSAGQILVALDDTHARASFSSIEGSYHAMAALRARLEAERGGLAEIRWPAWLLEEVRDEGVLAVQERIFETRRQSLDNHIAIYGQRIAQMREEVAGLEEEIEAQDQQIELLEEELEGLGGLIARGFERKSRYLALKRRKAEIAGERARSRARIARVEQSVGETRLRIAELGNAHLHDVVEDLRETELRISSLRERMSTARDVLSRTRVSAPVSGTVVNLRVFTRGGVVDPGEPLMDIVPAGDPLIIETRIAPTDIDVVYPDMPARVRLTAFSHLTTPPLYGKVLQVSADSLVDERTGAPFYEARVALDPEQPELGGLTLQPGMPAEVMIVTGKRTPLDYLLNPVVTSLGRALREE